MKIEFGLTVVILSILVMFYLLLPKCIRGHEQWVHHEAYTRYMLVGKVMIPQHVPARDSYDYVCDEYDR